MTVRRLVLLVEQLPPDARVWGNDGWDMDRELAAQAVELLGNILKAYAVTHADPDKPKRVDRTPVRLPRPWDDDKPKKSLRDSILAFADEMGVKRR